MMSQEQKHTPLPEDRQTCQICARLIMAKTGMIAHHGYQRPYSQGWQTNSCSGARELPFEVSRDILGIHIKGLEEFEAVQSRICRKMLAESVLFTVHHKPFRQPEIIISDISRNDFEEKKAATPDAFRYLRDYDELKDARVREKESLIKQIQNDLRKQKARFDSWKPIAIAKAEGK